MKKVLLFSRDPGGANTIIPLVEILKKRGYEVSLLGKDTSLKRYREFGLIGNDITKFVKKTDKERIKKILNKENPDFIITGTSANDFTEKYIWKAAEKLKIPVFAILDQWMSYGIRFSRYGVSELDKYNKKPDHDYLPTKVFVMDDFAKKEMQKTGIESDRIVVGGQPYFDLLLKRRKKMEKSGMSFSKNKSKMGKNQPTILFASEPIEKTYGGKIKAICELGYTEKTVLEELILTLRKISKEKRIIPILIIKTHPKEDPNDFKKIIKTNSGKNLKIKLSGNGDPWDLISVSDLVCGMVSMFLIESVLLKKKTLSIQIGLKGRNSFILDQRNILKSVVKKEELAAKLEELIINPKLPNYKFDFIKNASLNIINYIEKFYV